MPFAAAQFYMDHTMEYLPILSEGMTILMLLQYWDWSNMTYTCRHLSWVINETMFLMSLFSTWDLEPPSCSFCPGDIVREELERQVRVNWERPICSDNSGYWPTVQANRPSGDIFDVPGSYHIQYTLIDFANNVDKNCSFTITLKGNTLF